MNSSETMQSNPTTGSKKACFVAIGVNQGDAFFLRKGSTSVLIDGGKSKQGFPEQFRRVTNQDGVDVLVCTHNDADHVNGVLGFLRSGLKCKEVWLPGSWTYRLDELLRNPRDFIGELAREVDSIKGYGPYSLDEYSVKLPMENEHEESTEGKSFDLSETIEGAREINLDLTASYYLTWERNFFLFMFLDMFVEESKRLLFLDALSAAKRIREIALTAYHNGAKIRWFEYNKNFCNGGEEFLKPLNAKEGPPMTRRQWSALQHLALTTVNRQSLVFISPQNQKGPAVLFTADSDLSFPQSIQWGNGMIITAPHHGSESNAKAYKRLSNEVKNIDEIWVRSDGRFKKRPGQSYLGVLGNRYCTLCRGSYSKQDVRLTADSKAWQPDNKKVRRCYCT